MSNRMLYKNEWGSEHQNLDPQRTDLFRFLINLPGYGVNVWQDTVSFAVERFPFPDRAQQTFEMKYLNQVNHILGSDVATAPVEVPVRYAFTQKTAQMLYRWHALSSNPQTGSVVRTSDIKCSGFFYWLVPMKISATGGIGSMASIGAVEAAAGASAFPVGAAFGAAAAAGNPLAGLKVGMQYKLEGCMIINLKPTDANMTEGNVPVTLTFRLVVDRFYPINLGDANMIID